MDGIRLSSDREFREGVDENRGDVNGSGRTPGNDEAYPESIKNPLFGRELTLGIGSMR